jgi:probable phosphoglycerate mutase
MTRFIVVRHGETQWNIEARIQGHGDSPLTALGLAQAEAIAARLAAEPFDVLVSSDLGRALGTARRIAERTGHAVAADARFRERAFGTAEGLTYGEMDHRFPEAFSHVRATDPDYVLPGGESRRQFYGRIRAGFEALAREHAERCVAVVCHGGVLAALYRHIHAIAAEAQARIPIPNASYNRVIAEGDRWAIEVWGDTAHLAETAGSNGEPRGSILARMS